MRLLNVVNISGDVPAVCRPWRFFARRPFRQLSGEQGSMIIIGFFLIMATVIFGGLVIEVSRIIIATRELQAAADSASLMAVKELDSKNITGWQNSKKAVLLALSQARLSIINSQARAALQNQTLRFTTGSATPHDLSGYAYETATAGNLVVTVERALYCYDIVANNGTLNAMYRRWTRLEHIGAYCIANSAKVTLTVNNVTPNAFAFAVGLNGLQNLSLSGSASLLSPNVCGSDRCYYYGQGNPFMPHKACT